MSIRQYAVITTRGERPAELTECFEAAHCQISPGRGCGVVVVDNSDQGVRIGTHLGIPTVWDPHQPPNLSKLWNLGLNRVAKLAADEGVERYDVAVLNDDAVIPPWWFEQLGSAMREHRCVAAGYGPVDRIVVHREPGTTRLHERMPGWAFLLRGEVGIRADERFRWWCGDNDIDMQSRRAEGTLIHPRDEVKHYYPDQSTATRPELQALTGPDMARFVDKWGWRPW